MRFSLMVGRMSKANYINKEESRPRNSISRHATTASVSIHLHITMYGVSALNALIK